MKLLVTGGRRYRNDRLVDLVLREYLHKGMFVLIHGAASGADSLAAAWADYHEVYQIPYPANWSLYGNSAGPRRNVYMFNDSQPDCVVAFPGGSGTAHMIGLATFHNVPVRIL